MSGAGAGAGESGIGEPSRARWRPSAGTSPGRRRGRGLSSGGPGSAPPGRAAGGRAPAFSSAAAAAGPGLRCPPRRPQQPRGWGAGGEGEPRKLFHPRLSRHHVEREGWPGARPPHPRSGSGSLQASSLPNPGFRQRFWPPSDEGRPGQGNGSPVVWWPAKGTGSPWRGGAGRPPPVGGGSTGRKRGRRNRPPEWATSATGGQNQP